MSKGEKLVEVYKGTGETEAQIIKGLLESFGIPCILKSRVAPSVHMGMDEIEVMVWDSMAERARNLIKGDEYA